MSSSDAEFYEWVNRAADHGTVWKAVTEYYSGSEYLYRVRINGKTHTLPALTTPHWLKHKSPPDSVLGPYEPEKYMDAADIDVVQSRVDRIAYRADGKESGDIDDYIWNAERVKPILSLDEMRIDTGRSTYFSTLTQDERLVYEITRGLYDHGVSSDISEDALAEIVPQLELPERDQVAPSLPDLVSNFDVIAAPLGVNVLTVFNTGNGYELLIAERGESVAVHPSRLSLVPAGGIELTQRDEPSVSHTVTREFGEELFSIPEGQSVTSHPAVQELQRLRETGEAHMDLIGLYIAARRLGVNVLVVLLIDDPAYYEKYLSGGIDYNWEMADLHNVPLDDPNLADYLDPTLCVPPHVVGAAEGLLHLEDAYDLTPSFELKRESPR